MPRPLSWPLFSGDKPRQTDLAGIGISFGRNDDDPETSAVFILLLRPKGPAARTGHLEPMQEIISVDGWPVYGQDIATIAQHVRGPAGTHVILEVLTLPSKGRQTLKVEVARQHMSNSIVGSARKLESEAPQPSSAISAYRDERRQSMSRKRANERTQNVSLSLEVDTCFVDPDAVRQADRFGQIPIQKVKEIQFAKFDKPRSLWSADGWENSRPSSVHADTIQELRDNNALQKLQQEWKPANISRGETLGADEEEDVDECIFNTHDLLGSRFNSIQAHKITSMPEEDGTASRRQRIHEEIEYVQRERARLFEVQGESQAKIVCILSENNQIRLGRQRRAAVDGREHVQAN